MDTLISRVIETLTNRDDDTRHRTFEELIDPFTGPGGDAGPLRALLERLESFRRETDDPYERVRAALFLAELHGVTLMNRGLIPLTTPLPADFSATIAAAGDDEAVIEFLQGIIRAKGLNEFICSGLAEQYRHYAFRTLRELVDRAIAASPGNGMLFSTTSLSACSLRAAVGMTEPDGRTGLYPIIRDTVAVRLDPSHSGWSDIFFLGMDYPEGARVVNLSIDLSSADGHEMPQPPIETYIRMIGEPVLRLTSIDLGETRDITELSELFETRGDRLALLKAGIVASGLVPPSLRTSLDVLPDLLRLLLGTTGGIELCTYVRDIPAGSRLAVSTSLLASIIISCMRFSGQLSLEGPLDEESRRLVASRAILGEWMGGSGGGWQDSGGIWPGLKTITGRLAVPGDPEYGTSRGVLLPDHLPIAMDREREERLASSIILFHGGLAANIGPVLEMVTERYLLRLRREWHARLEGREIFDDIVAALRRGDMEELGRLTDRNFERCIRPIIPWVDNAFTARLRRMMRERFGQDLRGFLMLGGMTGGGMAFIVNPERRDEIESFLRDSLRTLHEEMCDSLNFAMKPAIFRFAVNHHGNQTAILRGGQAVLPTRSVMTRALRSDSTAKLPTEDHQAEENRENIGNERIPAVFDREDQERVRAAVMRGDLSVGRNRLSSSTNISDVLPDDVTPLPHEFEARTRYGRLMTLGRDLLKGGTLAVVTMAAGAGSRWTGGTSVVKATSPFFEIDGRHRSFLELHLAKTHAVNRRGASVPHVFTTSILTDGAIRTAIPSLLRTYDSVNTYVSSGTTVLQRMVPPPWNLLPGGNRVDDQDRQWRQLLSRKGNSPILRRMWQEGKTGESIEHCPVEQVYYPPGHFHEVTSLIHNGTLARLMTDFPDLRYLLVHNLDACGVRPDPLSLGFHADSGRMMTFEVTARRWSDRGGGLARIEGRTRLVEGLALPDPSWERRLSFYNTLTTLVKIDDFLGMIGIDRRDVMLDASNQDHASKVAVALAALTRRMPQYITIKTLRFRSLATGLETECPVLQCERLWGDITTLDDVTANYVAVHRFRGHQLKDPATLDAWARDGSAAHVRRLMTPDD